MGSMQVVFLFDLSTCKDFLLRPKEELGKKLLSVRSACIRLLTDFSSKSPNLKWGFKFFDSHDSKTQNMYKFAFSDVSLENFEVLENEICTRYERHLSFLQALVESSQKSETSVNCKNKREIAIDSPVNILQFALTQILCEFQWETMDMWSPSLKKIRNRAFTSGRRNFLFVFSDFKDNDESLFKYFGLNSSLSKIKFINTFLPQSLRDSLVKKSDIHLVLLNTCLDQKFMGSFTSKMLPLLSHSLQAVQGSLIPLSVLSQPLYNMKFSSLTEKNIVGNKVSIIENLCSSYSNSLLPFSLLFEQSLNQPFYSSVNTLIDECFIDIANKNEQIPVQVTEIFKKKAYVFKDVKDPSFLKNKCLENKGNKWSKFIVQFAVPRNSHYTAYEMFLCLPSDNDSSTFKAGSLKSLLKKICLDGLNLILECITEDGIKMPGMLTPLSTDTALISILDPSVILKVESDCKISATSSLKNGMLAIGYSNEIQNFKSELKNFPYNTNSEKLDDISLKPFRMECLEPWFKITPAVPKAATSLQSYIELKSANNSFKMESYWQLLKQSMRNGKSAKERLSKHHFTNDENKETIEKLTDDHLLITENQTKDMEEESIDLSQEEMLSAIRDIYNSAIESSGNAVTSSKRIVNMMANYCKKHSNLSIEEDISNIFKDNYLMTARGISEKYEMFDSEEAKEKKIKECQIQVLLILGIENLKVCPDRSNCVNNVTSLLRVMTFYSGLKDLQNFLHDVIQNSFSNNLYDILVEIGDELSIPILDDAESANSPADTLSSEFNNDDEIFSSVVSSVMSEKSTSSTSSRKGKENKDNGTMERKLLRHRSDISDTTRYRQVLLPRTSPKKKKGKTAANKAVRYSPRIAAKKNEPVKSVSEKTNKARRNLFSGDKANHTPKRNNNQLSTPKSKKAKYFAETPSHKLNNSGTQRGKSFIDQLTKSLKVIAESPKSMKTAKGGTIQESLQTTKETLIQNSNCHSFKDCTPESKRRLSLKLFSKLLISPTARMGIKKCTKRLFDQISPLKSVESNKRQKPNDESE